MPTDHCTAIGRGKSAEKVVYQHLLVVRYLRLLDVYRFGANVTFSNRLARHVCAVRGADNAELLVDEGASMLRNHNIRLDLQILYLTSANSKFWQAMPDPCTLFTRQGILVRCVRQYTTVAQTESKSVILCLVHDTYSNQTRQVHY